MEKLEDRWTSRDFPVLREVARRLDEAPSEFVTVGQVATATGLNQDDVIRAGNALADAGLVDTLGSAGQRIQTFTNISPEARRLTGLWPDAGDATDRLLWALEQQIQNTPDPEARGRLVKIRDAVTGAGRDLMVEVLAAVVTRQLPQ